LTGYYPRILVHLGEVFPTAAHVGTDRSVLPCNARFEGNVREHMAGVVISGSRNSKDRQIILKRLH
jgi:hypothetical protein